MTTKSTFRTLVTGLCCAMLLAGQLAQAAGPAFLTTSRVADVALTSAGDLRGQVLDAQGVAQPKIKVSIGQTNQQPTFVSTDSEGRFVVQGLAAGTAFGLHAQHRHRHSQACWSSTTVKSCAAMAAMVLTFWRIHG